MNFVTRSARKATRIISANLSDMSSRAHRSIRRQVNQDLNEIVAYLNSGTLLLEDIAFNNQPARKHMVTGWEVS